MPGRSSAVPGDTSKTESQAPLLGAVGQAGIMDQDACLAYTLPSRVTTSPTFPT